MLGDIGNQVLFVTYIDRHMVTALLSIIIHSFPVYFITENTGLVSFIPEQCLQNKFVGTN